MFDRTQVNITEGPAYAQHVHEHRAPTDASVKLLNEMRDKTLANIVASIPVEWNGFNANVAHYRDPSAPWDEIIMIKFDLNGQDCVFSHRRSTWRTLPQNAGVAVEELRDEFAKFLANRLLGNVDLRSLFKMS